MTFKPEDIEGMTITFQDARALGFCAAGIREMMRGLNVPMKDFLKDGIPASLVADDAFGQRVIEHKLKKAGG